MSNIIIPEGSGTVIGPDDKSVETVPTREISFEDAKLLREYKKFLLKMGLREALYCQHCWGHSLSDGCEAHVTDQDILIRCRCTMRFYKGTSY